ncbi:hypothetical protein AAG906_007975 [Vitis piasezkii]
MCGGDDHFAWKRPISSEACRGLRTDRCFLNLDLPSWVRVERRLVRFLEISDMNQQVVTVDQFTTAMVSIQEALASLRQKIGSQQSRPPVFQDETPHDSLPPPPPPPVLTVAPPAVVQTTIIDDVHTYGPYRATCRGS